MIGECGRLSRASYQPAEAERSSRAPANRVSLSPSAFSEHRWLSTCLRESAYYPAQLRQKSRTDA